MKTLDDVHNVLEEVTRLEAVLHATKLAAIARADALQAPMTDGARNLAEWVARHLDEHPDRAAQLVRSARGLSEPVADRLRDGVITVARADAYVAAEARGLDSTDLDGLDVAGVWQLVRRKRVAGPVERYLVIQPSLDLGSFRLHGRLGAVEGALVADTLTSEADRMVTGVPGADRATRSERLADALVSLAVGDSQPRSTVVIHTTGESAGLADSGMETVGGVAVTRGEVERALCADTTRITAVGPEGAKTKAPRLRRKRVPARVRHHVWWRDRHICAIDGCTSRYRLEIHHITPVSEGGTNDPENLMLVCWYHHHVVIHQRGFRVNPLSPPGRRRLTPTSRSP